MSYIVGPALEGVERNAIQNESKHSPPPLPRQRRRRRRRRLLLLNMIDVLFGGLVITPMAILFWASSWDILGDYLPFDFLTNSTLMFCSSNIVLLNAYLWQDKIQSAYNYLSVSYFNYYYGCGFLLRCLYTYIITMAYIVQWVGEFDKIKIIHFRLVSAF